MIPKREGYIPFRKYRTYYEIYGTPTDDKKLPLLVLHGGPGSAHNYLLDLQQLAKGGREVVFYDQLGAGKSDHTTDESLWNIDTFLEELETVRKALKLTDIHLLGHSWGGMLAIEYLLTKPKGVHSVVLASSMISMPLYEKEMAKLRAKLPGTTDKIMSKHEKAGTTDDQEYQKAYKVYSKIHMLRDATYPPHLSSPPEYFAKDIYEKMWGLSEVYANGTLRNWDKINKLKEIKIPTLIASGRFDELTPYQAEITQKEIQNSKQIVFERSGHLAHIEEPQAFNKAVEEFIESVERSA